MAYFDSLTLTSWRQFQHIDLDLSNQVTIITGSNGCGKTTVLSLLSRHFGWDIRFVSTPYVSKSAAKRLFKDVAYQAGEASENTNPTVNVGEIKYDDGEVCLLQVPTFVSSSYQMSFSNLVQRPGLFIPSHRQQPVYNSVKQIPTDPVSAAKMYEQYRSLAAQIYQSGYVRTQKSPGLVQKEAIIALAVFGEGNSHIDPNEEYRTLFDTFQERLRIIMPKEIGFQRLKINMPEVVLATDSGDFSLDAMSGGVSSVFNIAWQVQMFDLSAAEYTIVIDEPENHLHPSMQRSILPALTEAFPNARFVVATHSPFIVSSSRASNIYVLLQNELGKVVSQKLDDVSVAGPATTILRDILGVKSTIPLWVEEIIKQCLEEDIGGDPRAHAELIMNRLGELGIAGSLSEFTGQ